MTEIKEIKDLNTIAGIRRVTQDSLKPVIDQIQRKMAALSKETQQVSSKTQHLLELEKRQGRNEQSVRYMQTQLLQLREHCQSIQLQQANQKETWNRSDEKMRDEIRKLKKDKEKQDVIIEKMGEKTERMNKQLANALQSVKKREELIQTRFKTLSDRSQNLSIQVKQTTEQLNKQFKSMSQILTHELKSSERRLKLLDMYEAQRDIINKKMKELTQAVEQGVKYEEYEYYKECLQKQQQSVIDSIKQMIQSHLSETTRDLLTQLPQMKESLLHCLDFERLIEEGKSKMSEIHDIIAANKNLHEESNSQFKVQLEEKFQLIEEERKVMNVQITKALSFESQLIEKLDIYSEKLKDQLRQQNYRKSRQLYEQIKVSFADKKQEMRQRELQRIIQERLKLFNRCLQIEELGNKIGEILTNFATRITKIKSDCDMFVDRIRKQMQQVDFLRKQINDNANKIGEILSQVMETILLNNCIEIEGQAKTDDQLAFSTKFDGVIYQRYSKSKMQPHAQAGKIIYRRKVMDMKLLKRALVASMTYIYDELMDEACCLGWHQQSPSIFFKDHIEPIYRNLSLKYQDDKSKKQGKDGREVRDGDTIDLSTIPIRQIRERQTIGSVFDTTQSHNFNSNMNSNRKYTVRSRKRYDQSNEIFASKSVRKVRGTVNSSLGV